MVELNTKNKCDKHHKYQYSVTLIMALGMVFPKSIDKGRDG